MPLYDDIATKFTLDASEFDSGASKVSKTIDLLSNDFTEITNATNRYNKEGELVGVTFRAINKEGQKVGVTLKRQKDEWQVMSRNINRASKSLEEMNKESKKWFQSFPTKQVLIRIGAIQFFHQNLRVLLSFLRQSIDQFVEFNLRAAEVQTISLNAAKSTKRWTEDLRGLSDAFGLKAIDTAEAAYQALSNQVTGAAGATTFLRDTSILATISVSSLADAVNITSSAINAFGLSTGQTSEISASFFKTVELGRLRINEIANDFGTSANLADQLGVTLYELNASLAVITRSGIKAAQAQTLVNAVMQKLIQPTKAMKQLLRDWGVESGEAAISAFGLSGVLERLGKEVETGGISRIGELFSRLRATRGLSALLKDVNAFNEALATVGGTAEGLEIAFRDQRRALDAILTNTGKQIEILRTRLENVAQFNFGQFVAEQFLAFNDAVGGFDELLEGFVEAWRAIAVSSVELAKVLKPVFFIVKQFIENLPTLTILIGGWVGIQYALIPALQATNAGITAMSTAVASGIPLVVAFEASITALTASLFGLNAVGLAAIVALTFAWDALTTSEAEAAEAARKFREEQERIAQIKLEAAIVDARREVEAYDAQLQQANKNASAWITKQQGVIDQISNRLTPALELVSQQNFPALYDAIDRTQASMKNLVSDAIGGLKTVEQNVQSAKESLSALAEDALFEGLNVSGLNQIFQKIQQLRGQGIGAALKGNFEEGRQALEDAESIVIRLAKVKLENFEQARRDVESAMEAIVSLGRSGEQRAFRLEISQLEGGRLIQALEGRIAKLQQRAEQVKFIDPEQARQDLAEVAQITEEIISAQSKNFNNVAVNADRYRDAVKAQQVLETELIADRQKVLADEQALQQKVADLQQKMLRERIRVENNISNQIQTRFNIEAATLTKYEEQVQKRQELNELAKEYEDTIARYPQLISNTNKELLKQQLNFQQSKIDLRERIVEGSSLAPGVKPPNPNTFVSDIFSREGIQGVVQAIERGTLIPNEDAKKAIEAYRDVTNDTTRIVRDLVENLQLFNDKLKEARQNLPDTINKIDSIKNEPSLATGGLLGGLGGHDTQMFAGSRGEFVLRREAVRRFLPQVTALNAGSRSVPQYTRNIDIGSINVNVEGGGTPVQTARQIGVALNREIARGTFSWS